MIPTFNRRDLLLRCIGNIPPEVPIVVVDDGSSDGTEEAIAHLGRTNLQCMHQENAGPAAARNAGWERAGTDLVIFTDDDCIPAAGWARAMTSLMDRLPKSVGGVGGRVLPLGDGWVSRYSTFHRILEPPASCSYLVTANCCYRRSAIAEAGGFDSRIRRPGGEDPGLSLRVRRLGYELMFEPSAIVYHQYRENIIDFARTFFRYGEGCACVLGE